MQYVPILCPRHRHRPNDNFKLNSHAVCIGIAGTPSHQQWRSRSAVRWQQRMRGSVFFFLKMTSIQHYTWCTSAKRTNAPRDLSWQRATTLRSRGRCVVSNYAGLRERMTKLCTDSTTDRLTGICHMCHQRCSFCKCRMSTDVALFAKCTRL